MHPIGNHRRRLIESFIDTRGLKIVEIGALTTPTFPPDEFCVRFIDYASRDELARIYANNKSINPAKLVDVHYVMKNQEYSKYINERYDLAIANHVIEHVPDTIRWLGEIHAILKDDGYLFLSVPDRRYTFDYLKRESNFIDVYRAYIDRQTKPSAAQLLENRYFSRRLTTKDCWDGSAAEKAAIQTVSLRDARRYAEEASKSYVSTHCHTYTYNSFRLLFAQLQELDLIHFTIVDMRDVDIGANEFHAMLQRTTTR